MIFGEDNFTFKPAPFYPFTDLEDIARVRAITKEDILAMNLIIFHSRETLSLFHFDTMPVFPLISLIRLCFVLII